MKYPKSLNRIAGLICAVLSLSLLGACNSSTATTAPSAASSASVAASPTSVDTLVADAIAWDGYNAARKAANDLRSAKEIDDASWIDLNAKFLTAHALLKDADAVVNTDPTTASNDLSIASGLINASNTIIAAFKPVPATPPTP